MAFERERESMRFSVLCRAPFQKGLLSFPQQRTFGMKITTQKPQLVQNAIAGLLIDKSSSSQIPLQELSLGLYRHHPKCWVWHLQNSKWLGLEIHSRLLSGLIPEDSWGFLKPEVALHLWVTCRMIVFMFTDNGGVFCFVFLYYHCFYLYGFCGGKAHKVFKYWKHRNNMHMRCYPDIGRYLASLFYANITALQSVAAEALARCCKNPRNKTLIIKEPFSLDL